MIFSEVTVDIDTIMKLQQRGGKLQMPTLIGAVIILAILVGLYMYMKKREGFETPVIVRYYYLPECGWCKRFKPEWEAFVNNLEEDKKVNKKLANVKVEAIDGSVQKVPVEGFPTVHLVGKDGKPEEFRGERTSTALMDAVLKMVA